MRDLLQFDKIGNEVYAFYREVVIENGPRYKDWKNYGDLWTDLWVSLFSMSYTLGHIVAVGLPLWGLYSLYELVANK